MDNILTAENIIGQDILRQVEALCVQEEPPACMSACPLHVDVRQLAGLIKQQKLGDAWKLYAKTVPFAPIIARTCAAPCQIPCKRQKLGGAVQVQKLEQAAAVLAGQATKPPFLLPKKLEEVAIIGGGLRGMAAANDLARKGYKITMFEAAGRLGGKLWNFTDSVLPQAVLEAEIASLLKMPVTVRYHTMLDIETPQAAETLLGEGFSAVFVACASPLGKTANPDTLLTPLAGIVAGRRQGRMQDEISTIHDLFDGRSAATTIDRLIQGVSLTAGREKEGSYETRLYTSLDGIEPSPSVVAENPDGYTLLQAVQEAERCLQCECMECVKKCGFLQKYKGSPRRYVREVYNNLSIAMGNHDANTMINTCALCSQCEAVCPNGLDMAQVFSAARQRMVQTGKMPQSAHEFALLDMDYSLSPQFYMARHAPGQAASKRVFFPGCQLAASEPELVRRVYAALCRQQPETGLWLACCGIMAKWAGNTEKLAEVASRLRDEWEAMGRPKVVAACPSCAQTLNDVYGIETEFIAETLRNNDLITISAVESETLYLHHACGARYNSGIQSDVAAVAAITGAVLVQSSPENQSPCCGYGGLVPFVSSGVAGEITRAALTQINSGHTADAANKSVPPQQPVYLTYCVNCRDRFLEAGQPAVHLLERVFPGDEGLKRKNPTWSQRQENRAGLRRSLLSQLWGEEREEIPDMELFISPELEEKIQETHILHSDIRQAIGQAEQTGSKLADTQTGHFIAQYRPANVTFWVEYLPENMGYRVYNAYCHRMAAEITGHQPLREDER